MKGQRPGAEWNEMNRGSRSVGTKSQSNRGRKVSRVTAQHCDYRQQFHTVHLRKLEGRDLEGLPARNEVWGEKQIDLLL